MFSFYSMWSIFRMRELGEKEALLVKQVDSGIRCSWSWAWLKLDATIEVKEHHTLSLFLTSSIQWIQMGMSGVTLCLKEINYATKGYHALLARCRTDVHMQKVYNVITCSVAQRYCFCCVEFDSREVCEWGGLLHFFTQWMLILYTTLCTWSMSTIVATIIEQK